MPVVKALSVWVKACAGAVSTLTQVGVCSKSATKVRKKVTQVIDLQIKINKKYFPAFVIHYVFAV